MRKFIGLSFVVAALVAITSTAWAQEIAPGETTTSQDVVAPPTEETEVQDNAAEVAPPEADFSGTNEIVADDFQISNSDQSAVPVQEGVIVGGGGCVGCAQSAPNFQSGVVLGGGCSNCAAAPMGCQPCGTQQVGCQQVGCQPCGTQQVGCQQVGCQPCGCASAALSVVQTATYQQPCNTGCTQCVGSSQNSGCSPCGGCSQVSQVTYLQDANVVGSVVAPSVVASPGIVSTAPYYGGEAAGTVVNSAPVYQPSTGFQPAPVSSGCVNCGSSVGTSYGIPAYSSGYTTDGYATSGCVDCETSGGRLRSRRGGRLFRRN